jgi:hypothetical protein
MRPDTFTNTPEDAAAYERLRARDADLSEPYGFVEVTTPYCSRCARGTKGYVCGPCQRAIERAELEDERNEEYWSE